MRLPCRRRIALLGTRFLVSKSRRTRIPLLSCLSTYIPHLCNSTTSITCICTNTKLTAAVIACDTVPELLQLDKYSAVSCGFTGDKSRLDDGLKIDYVFPFLTALFLAGRIISRVTLDVGLGADDWTMLAAGAAYFVDVGASLGLNRFGEHKYWLLTEQVVKAL